jgi:hypothetical protein
MQPRIYTYKITFEEIPDWYWGIHKETKHGEFYMGSPYTHAWKWEFYTPSIQILEEFEYSENGWLEAGKIEERLIKADLNNPLCLNENCGGSISLQQRKQGGRTTAQKTVEMRLGFISEEYMKSEKYFQDRSKVGKKTAQEGTGCHKKEHRSKGGKKGGKSSTSQVWESLIDGFRSNAGCVAYHNKARGWDPDARIRVE